MNYEICECCGKPKRPKTPIGRWPSNLVHDGSAEVLAGFPMTSSTAQVRHNGAYKSVAKGQDYPHDTYGFNDTGSAARFFYCAKASKQDRDEGCEDLESKQIGHYAQDEWSRQNMGNTPDARRDPVRNHHPTVKPTALMRYLCRLVTPPGGVILDPFMGSGSTGKAAILEGFNFVGIDTEQEYIEIAARRIEYACGKMGIVIDQPMLIESRREMAEKPKQMILL